MKISNRNFFGLLLVISLPIFLLLLSIEIASFQMDFFEKKYEEYNISKRTGLSDKDLLEVTEALLDYLKGEREDIILYKNINGIKKMVFEERELLHLRDVKVLYRKGFTIKNTTLLLSLISLFYFIVYRKNKFHMYLFISSILPMIIMIVFSILINTDFYKYFVYFHEILFTNDLWQLNPNTDILIKMYPLNFFYSIAKNISILYISELFILLSISIYLMKKHKF